MNTFLQVCQRLHLLLRTGEDKVGTAPTTVIGQEGMLSEIVEWVKQSNIDIINAHPSWSFMTTQGTLALPASTQEVNPATTIGDYGTILPYDASRGSRFALVYKVSAADETPVYFTPWQLWAGGVYNIGTRSEGRPYRFTINPSGNLELDPIPDDAYTLRFDYRKTVQTLANDSDVPLVPAGHRMAIVFHAITNYYCMTRDSTIEFRSKAEVNLQREMRNLYRDHSPEYLI